jgi:hypothetical protein
VKGTCCQAEFAPLTEMPLGTPQSRETLAQRGRRSLPRCRASIGVSAFDEQASRDYDSDAHTCGQMNGIFLDARDRAAKRKLSSSTVRDLVWLRRTVLLSMWLGIEI